MRWKGASLAPCSLFDKGQRDSLAAITEDKSQSAVLEHVKAEQERSPQRGLRLAGSPPVNGASGSTPGTTLSPRCQPPPRMSE